jgi:hypothetical protein
MSVRRKLTNLLNYCNPFAANLSPPQDDALPARKRPRLETSTSISTAEDAADADTFFDAQTTDTVTTVSPDDAVAVAPTYTVTVSASLPSAGASPAPVRSWTSEQDAKLIDGVKEHGKKWVAVAAMVPGRTNRQCRSRWAECLDPGINTGKWTPEEDAMLADAVKKHGHGYGNWAAVAALVPGRTNMQCSKRWRLHLDATATIYQTTTNTRWTMEEVAKLTDAVKVHGKNWAAVAVLVPGRTNTQCGDKWRIYLDPDGKRYKAD